MTLKFALIKFTTNLTDWQDASVRQLLADRHELTHVLQIYPQDNAIPDKLINQWQPVWVPGQAKHFNTHAEDDLSDVLESFLDSEAQTDFALCFVPLAIFKGKIPSLRLGLWIWRFGKTASLEVEQMGEDEFLAGDKFVSAWLLMCAELSGEAIVLNHGCFKAVDYSLQATRQRVLATSSNWPARACLEYKISSGYTHLRTCKLVEATQSAHKISIKFLLWHRQVIGFLRKAMEEFLIEEQWTLGVLDKPGSSFLDSPEITDVLWLPELSGGNYLADPMMLISQGDCFVMAEEFDAKRGRGHICKVSLSNPEKPTVAIDADTHLSYPYLFHHNEGIYCVPESSEQREVRLYKSEHFPGRWKLVDTMLELPGVDCSMIRFGEYWWLLGGNHEDQDQTKLFGWYSLGINGPWKEHPLNPIKIDVGSARSAGAPFWHEGKLYRPAQDCSRTYGGAIVINRVDELSPKGFREEIVARIDPVGRYSAGVHTISSAGNKTVIDGKRHYISLRKAIRVLSQWFK